MLNDRKWFVACGLLSTLCGCHRDPSFSLIPAGQEAAVAEIARTAPSTAPPRTGGFLMPQETGRQIRAQAIRPPTPGATNNPPPAGT